MDLRESINYLLREGSRDEFGCVMLHVEFPEIKKIHQLIDKNDLYIDENDPTYGLESYPHCTLLFGLHDGVTTPEVQEVIKDYEFSPLRAHNPSIFVKDKYDVLKFEVGYTIKSGSFLTKINNNLKEFPHTNKFPTYNPHITIAYLKSGLGQKYVKLINEKYEDLIINPDYVMYIKPDGSQDEIKIKIKK
jgi:hypothetical protein